MFEPIATEARWCPPNVLKATLDLALEIAREGREGRRIGTLFSLGNAGAVLARSRPLILDPVAGHPRTRKDGFRNMRAVTGAVGENIHAVDAAMQKGFKRLENRISKLHKKSSTMQNKISAMNGKLSRFDNRLSTMDSKLTAFLDVQVQILRGSVARVAQSRSRKSRTRS